MGADAQTFFTQSLNSNTMQSKEPKQTLTPPTPQPNDVTSQPSTTPKTHFVAPREDSRPSKKKPTKTSSSVAKKLTDISPNVITNRRTQDLILSTQQIKQIMREVRKCPVDFKLKSITKNRYQVHSILDYRTTRNYPEYRVQWEMADGSFRQSWEPAHIIAKDAPRMAEMFQEYILRKESAMRRKILFKEKPPTVLHLPLSYRHNRHIRSLTSTVLTRMSYSAILNVILDSYTNRRLYHQSTGIMS